MSRRERCRPGAGSSPPASPGPGCPHPPRLVRTPHVRDGDSHPRDTSGHPDVVSWGGVQGKETQGLGTRRKGDPGMGDSGVGTGMGSWARGPQRRGPWDGVAGTGAPAEGVPGVGDLGVGSRAGSWTWGHQGKGTQGWGTQGWVPEDGDRDGDLGMGSQGKGSHGWGRGWGPVGSRHEMGHRAGGATPVLPPPCPVLAAGCHRGPRPLDPMAAPSGLTLLATYLALQLATGEQLGTLGVALVTLGGRDQWQW